MFEYLAIFSIGIFVGYLITVKLRKSDLVGTLQIIETADSDRPYIFLELDKDNVDEICTMKYVSMRVKDIHQNSHE